MKLFSTRKNDCLESKVIYSIRLQIEEIFQILTQETKEISDKELYTKMYLVTARIIALTALREGKKSPIFHYLKKNKKYDSLLTQTTMQEIDTLKYQLTPIKK
ncbi:hypothetical protein C0030_005065 [Candidatus Liberibacter solanacearum]|uniref:Uncharacterized protein n=1 Tax=Candidatus Liberibacter solanacearum TaxID=556287 RepID=A0A3R7QMA5_9HYPH|nr:hypothetical protein C0030_005065 [Candidatus Liberibacter solanacearum]